LRLFVALSFRVGVPFENRSSTVRSRAVGFTFKKKRRGVRSAAFDPTAFLFEPSRAPPRPRNRLPRFAF
jgi:hypothetical protein